MKHLFTGFACLLITCCFISCKKEKECPVPDAPSMVGFWQGKYGGSTVYPTSGYAALFRSNGTVRIYDGTDTATAGKAEGTYNVSGNTVTATYNYSPSIQYSISATVDSKFTFLEGTYGSGTNTTNGGRWFMNKK
ncbi:hypothetical protein PDL71_04880 [Lacibacter sp. MH-610]|uniref:hypothetical protein n=1 Tax=Lacibacter sp. MH-610 TaxID=3020883 RepID=UPI0038916D65